MNYESMSVAELVKALEDIGRAQQDLLVQEKEIKSFVAKAFGVIAAASESGPLEPEELESLSTVDMSLVERALVGKTIKINPNSTLLAKTLRDKGELIEIEGVSLKVRVKGNWGENNLRFVAPSNFC